MRHPEALDWLIIQNTNAYEIGFTTAWDGFRNALWKNRSPETERPLAAFLEAGGTCESLAARRAAGTLTGDSRREAMLAAACDDGSASSCTNLALLYEQRGTDGDAARALAFYDVGCRGGSARGCAYLGRAYERGRGVTADGGRAVQLYQQACAAKDAWGCGYLGQAYATGRSVAKDPARGKALLEQACDGGVTWSCDRVTRP